MRLLFAPMRMPTARPPPRQLPLVLLLTAILLLSHAAQAAKEPQTKDDLKPLSEIDAWDVVGIVLMACGLAAASAGGVGGGTILVPLLVLIMGFDIKFATPSSNFIIMGGATANAMFNLRKRHPFADRPLVDPDICLAMIPSMMGGAVIGAFLSKMLPSYIISILLVVLLVVAGFRTTQKAIRLYKKETAAKAAPSDTHALHSTHDDSRVEDPSHDEGTLFEEMASPKVQVDVVEEASSTDSDMVVKNREQELQLLLAAEHRFNWKKHGMIFLCFLGILAASIIGAQVSCGSVTYWVVLWLEIPWTLCFTTLFVLYIAKHRAYKLALGFPFITGDIAWTAKTSILFPFGCMLAGVVAALFGIGGAIVAGPLMLEMGVIPEVASSTSALLVLYSSAAASAKFALFNQIAWDWSITLCGLAFIVTSVAQIFILGYVRRSGRQSIIVFCIAITVCIGACLMTYSAIKTTIDTSGEPFTVDFCD